MEIMCDVIYDNVSHVVEATRKRNCIVLLQTSLYSCVRDNPEKSFHLMHPISLREMR